MRFVSLRFLAEQARQSAARFPLVLVSALTAAAAGIVLVGDGNEEAPARVLLTALLGFPTFTALTITGERAGWSGRKRVLVQGSALLLLVLFSVLLERWTEAMRFTRFAHLAVIAHLSVAVLPFAGTALSNSFWQFNRLLFVRYLVGGIFAAVLFGGLALAIVAIDNLFAVRVDEEWYARLWMVTALVFHPWFFLAGVPRDLVALESREDYPPGLKVFAQFILIPVVTVYVLILTAYLVRVLVTRTWPSGWIGYLVSSVAAAGTLALLLVHPARRRADSKWVDVYGRWFYVALIPSIVMLLMAVWLRVEQYGLTERRYFLAALALWLAGIALYYGLSGAQRIRIIPATLLVLAAVTFAGPWSAYAMSRRSQTGRLREMLARNGILIDGRIAPEREVDFTQRSELSDVLRYLIDWHGPDALAPLSPELHQAARSATPGSTDARVDNQVAQAVMRRLGLTYVSRWDTREGERLTRFTSGGRYPIALEGFEWMTRANLATAFAVDVGGDSISFAPDSQPARVIVSRGGRRILEIPLWQLLGRAREAQSADTLPRPVTPGTPPAPAERAQQPGPPPLIVDAEGGGLALRLVVTNLVATGDSTSARITSADATILLRFLGQAR